METARGLCRVHWQLNRKNSALITHAYNLIEMIKSDPNFLDSILTGDESWGFAYEP